MTTVAKKKRQRRPARVRAITTLPPDPPRSAHTLDRLTLDGRSARLTFGQRIVNATRTPTIEGPTPLQIDVWDGDGVVLGTGVLGARVLARVVTLRLDGLTYVVASNSRSSGVLSIQCEHQNVSLLRSYGFGKPIRAKRSSTMTRQHFCATMIKAAGVPVIVLDENVAATELKAAVTNANASSKKTTKTRTAGLSGTLTAKGAPATPAQRRVMAQVFAAALPLNPSPRALLALTEACIVENVWSNSSVQNDGTSEGVLQVLASTAQGMGISATDINACVRAFFLHGFIGTGVGAIALARQNPSWTTGMIAQACQGSAYPARYDVWHDEAVKVIAAAGGQVDSDDASTSTSTATTSSVEQAYYFERLKTEGTWTCCRRLLDEVQWRLFEREGVIIIATDAALMRAAPSLDIDAKGPYVDQPPDFEQLRGSTVSEATVRLLASQYQVDPGEVARVLNQGQLDPRWLIQDATIDLTEGDPWVDTTLIQPRAALPEPAAEVATTSSGSSSSSPPTSSSGGTGQSGKVIVASSANRPGVSLQKPVLEFLGLMAGLLGFPVTVTTGTNHNRLTVDGNVSDHWDGNAADLGIGGDIRFGQGDSQKGDKYASAALQICGTPKAKADAMAHSGAGLDFSVNYRWQGHRVQIGWRTLNGGNHWTHVHVGVA